MVQESTFGGKSKAMDAAFLLGLAAFSLSFFASTQMTRKGMLGLSMEEKARLVDLSGTGRGYGILIVFALSAVGYLVFRALPEYRNASLIAMLGLLLLLAVAALAVGQRRLRRIGMPETFLRASLMASVLRVAGIVGLFVAMFWPILGHALRP
jgi:hypothetical protein